MNIEVVIGGLVGSILTVLITKGLDIFADREKNKFELKKAFFEKKLEAAEAMMSSYYSVTSAMSGLDSLYSLVSHDRNQNINWKAFGQFNDTFSSRLNEFGQTALSAKSAQLSFPLYFDIGDELWGTGIYQEYLSSLLRIANLEVPLKTAIKIATENNDPKMDEWCFEQIEKVWDEYRKEMISLSPILKKIKAEFIDGMKILRVEMKKYE